jgi:thioredoxin 1
MSENTITATDQNFKDLISGDTPVLVDFWAEWCTPCRMISPIVEEIAVEYSGKLRVAKLNVDENPQTAGTYDVMSIPTLIVYEKGEMRKRLVGAMPKAKMLMELKAFTDRGIRCQVSGNSPSVVCHLPPAIGSPP